jgi:hypothetical protein
MYYNARWYDPSLGRFAQADTIVPDGVQGYDRYAYVGNNPVNYADPSGHFGNRGDDKSDYRNRQNERRVHALETRWYAAEMLRRALEEQRNARLASIAHTTDGSALGFEDFRKTLLAPQASAGGPDWGKVATGVALIFTVDFLVVAPIVIGMIAGAPEFEIGMVLSEAWSWPLAGGVVYANVRGFNLIREGFAGPGQP